MNMYYIHKIFAVALILCFTTAFAAGYENDYVAAMDQIARKEYSEGVKTYYKFLLKVNPTLSIWTRKRDLSSAYAHFKNVSAANPSDSNAKLFLSLVFRIIENWRHAQASLEEIQKRHPSSCVLLFIKGEIFLGMDQIDKAIGVFQKLRMVPRASKLVILADLLMKRRGIDKSASVRRAALLKRAYRHLDLLENVQAEAAFRLLIREFPEEVEGYRALIDLLVEERRFDHAERVLDTFRNVAGAKAQIPLQEARFRYFQGRFQEVVDILLPLEEREQTNDYFVFFLAESCFNIGKFAKSAVLFHRLSKNDPENLGFRLREAASLEGMGNQTLAVETMKRELYRRSDSALLRMELGCLLERMNRLDEAKAEYQILADSESPFQFEAKRKLDGLVVRLVEEEKQRLRRSFSEQHSGNGLVGSSSVPDAMVVAPEKNENSRENKNMIETISRQQSDLSKRLEQLSD